MKNYWYIGDIHGEIDLLDSLLGAIFKHDPERVIFLGDYIDRGPHSRQVVDRIMELEVPKACLMGNHELMLLSAYEDSPSVYNPMELWYRNGGEATLQSFGFSGFFSFQSQMEEHYLDFFRNLRMSDVVEVGAGKKILATHAGISPSIPVADQLLLKDYQDLLQYMTDRQLDLGDSFLWARETFFSGPEKQWKGYMVIHGHTPTLKLMRIAQEEDYPHFHFVGNDLAIRRKKENGEVVSVGIDSGSGLSGRLSGLGIFVEPGTVGGEMLHMRSITVSREDILPRDLGSIGV
jgi:serine/threonine protein phosphatase 1